MFLLQLCNYSANNVRETIVDIKANKIELEIEDILNEVSKIWFEISTNMPALEFDGRINENRHRHIKFHCHTHFSLSFSLPFSRLSTQKSDNGCKQFAKISKR